MASQASAAQSTVAPTKLVVDVSNTSKESRAAVTQAVDGHPMAKSTKRSFQANVLWIDRALPIQRFYLQRMGSNRRMYQRTNRFFGMGDRLAKCGLATAVRTHYNFVHNCRKGNPAGFIAPFFPATFCVPEDEGVAEQAAAGNSDKWYIVKPSLGRCGRGMLLAKSLKSALEGWRNEETMDYGTSGGDLKPVSKAYVAKEGGEEMKGPFPAIIQEYIPQPMLFGGTGRKFDLRIYVVVTDMQGTLEAAVYTEGLVRCCCLPYETPSAKNARTPHIHLTNSKINPSASEGTAEDSPAEVYKGLLSEWLSGLGATRANGSENVAPSANVSEGIDTGAGSVGLTEASFWDQVHTIVSETLLAIQPTTNLLYDTCFGTMDRESGEPSRSFQTVGFDVMADEAGKVWLLEVNNNPSLNLDTDVDKTIKLPLLEGILNVLSYGLEAGLARSNGEGTDRFALVRPNPAALERLNRIRKTYNKACGWYDGGKKPMKDTPMPKQTRERLQEALGDNGKGAEGKYYDTLESFTNAVVRMRDQMADEEVEAERTLMEKLGALLVADR